MWRNLGPLPAQYEATNSYDAKSSCKIISVIPSRSSDLVVRQLLPEGGPIHVLKFGCHASRVVRILRLEIIWVMEGVLSLLMCQSGSFLRLRDLSLNCFVRKVKLSLSVLARALVYEKGWGYTFYQGDSRGVMLTTIVLN